MRNRVLALSLLVPVTASAFSVLSAAPAHADTRKVADARDKPKSRLDLKSASTGHGASGKVTTTLTTYQSFTKKTLMIGYRSYFAIVIDTNGVFSSPERIVFIFTSSGRLTARVTDSRGKIVGGGNATKPGTRSVSVTFRSSLLGKDVPEYWWEAFSFWGADPETCKRPCADAAPNRAMVPHDIATPDARFTSVPDPSTSASANTTFPVGFEVSDRGGSGLASWSVKQRIVGSSDWTKGAEGQGEGTTAELQGEQGTTYEVCVAPVDAAGNRGSSDIRRVTVPYDDANTSLASGYSGAWMEGGSDADNFMGTLHTSSIPGAQFSIVIPTDGLVNWIAPGGFDGVAAVQVNGQSQGTVSMSSVSGHRQSVWSKYLSLSGGSYTITITVQSGTVPLDAFSYEPPSSPPPPIGHEPTCA